MYVYFDDSMRLLKKIHIIIVKAMSILSVFSCIYDPGIIPGQLSLPLFSPHHQGAVAWQTAL